MISSKELPSDEKDQISHLMGNSYIPGMSIATVSKGNIQTATLGVTDTESKKAVTSDSIFWACSLSKPVFAYLVLKLIQNGKLASDFLDSKLWDEKRFGPRGDNHWLTPRMILSHQSGLPNEGPPEFKFKPGEGYRYSGEGYFYLQKVIEEQTGHSLQELAKEWIFDPVGMSHSSFSLPEAELIVECHDEMQHPRYRLPKMMANNNNAAGSLHTTANDYARFLVHCMEDKEFKTLITPQHISMTRDFDAKGKVDDKTLQAIDWGLGWGIQKTNEGNIAFHWGHGPGARAFVAINMDTKEAAVYFANSDNGLALTQDVMKTVGNLQPAMDFLSKKYGYEHYKNPDFIKKHQKIVSEEKDQDEMDLKRLKWMSELVKAKSEPVEIKAGLLEQYAGEYPPNKIRVTDNKLELELFGHKHELIPINATTFASKTDLTFRIEFDVQNKQATTHFLFPNPEFGFQLKHNKFTVIDKMLENTFNKFNLKLSEFKEMLGENNFSLLRSETPVSKYENYFVNEHKEDFDVLSALAVKRRICLTAILTAEKGLEALEKKLINFADLIKMPHSYHISAILSEHGVVALKEGLLSANDISQFGENSGQYLQALCTEEGISLLRKCKNEGTLALTMASFVEHARKYNNVGVLEHAMKENVSIDVVQADVDRVGRNSPTR